MQGGFKAQGVIWSPVYTSPDTIKDKCKNRLLILFPSHIKE